MQIKNNEQLYDILKHCLIALNCPRQRHYPNKNYGSRICEGQSLREVLDYSRQALSNFDGVMVKSVEAVQDGYVFTVLINNEEGQVKIRL